MRIRLLLSVLAAVAMISLGATQANATILIQLQYGSQSPVIVANEPGSSTSFTGTFGASGTGCVATAANCYSLSVVGIDPPGTAPDLVSFELYGSAPAASLPGMLTIYVQQFPLGAYVGNLTTSYAHTPMTGSVQKAQLFSFVNTTQISSQTFTTLGGVNVSTSSVNFVNAPLSDTLVYQYTFGQGAATFADGISLSPGGVLSPVPVPIVGAGLPSLLLAFGGVLVWRRRMIAAVRPTEGLESTRR